MATEHDSRWEARDRLGREHDYPILREIADAGQTRAFGLGSAGMALLPDGVRARGFAAIDALAAYLAAAWPDAGVGQSLEDPHLAGYVELLGIGEIMDQLLPRIRARDATSLIAESAALLKRNPMMVVMMAEMAALEAKAGPAARIFPFRDEPAAQDDLRDSVVYAALMEAIGLACLLAPKPTTDEERGRMVQARLFDILEARRNAVDWKATCNLFEVLKIELVAMPMKERLRSKQGLDDASFDDKPGDGLTLQLNVLDAMYGETHLGNDDNAACGFEMFCQTSDKPAEPLLGEALNDEWIHDGQKMGVARMHIAFNEAWVSLYSSWNGCFCSNYGDLMYAKLYNPGVAGAYLDIDHFIYFFARVCTLYTHVNMMVLSRVKTGRRDLKACNWEDPALRHVWGRINKVAGAAYQQRVEAALRGDAEKHLRYQAWHAARHAMWVALRAVIQEATRVEDGGERARRALRRLLHEVGGAQAAGDA
jgi:hypothetical protein